MSELIGLVAFFVLLTMIVANSVQDENRLRALSITWLILLVLSFSTITTEWARMTSELVDEEDDPHYGLPDIWEGEQVVCFHFPEGYAPTGFDDGRHHIDNDGTEFMTDDDWNETGVCVGGFSGYNNGWNLLNTAVNTSGNSLELNTTVFPFGLMVNSIGGIDPSLMTGDFGGAYWSLYHNGGLSMVGITDLELDSDSVITWRVDTW